MIIIMWGKWGGKREEVKHFNKSTERHGNLSNIILLNQSSYLSAERNWKPIINEATATDV